jgi:hypothetical protein
MHDTNEPQHVRRVGRGILLVVVTALLATFLTGCATTNSSCPPWPKAGPEVAKELKRTLQENGQPKPEWEHFWLWMQRLNKLQKQLEVCHEP